MRRSDRLATTLVVSAALVATFAGALRVVEVGLLDPDEVAAAAQRTLVQPHVLNALTTRTESEVRRAFLREGRARPEDSYVRTRRALETTGADPAVVRAVVASAVAQHAALLDDDAVLPAALALDTSPRQPLFVAGWSPDPVLHGILVEHLQIEPTVPVASGGWVDGVATFLRAADVLVPLAPLFAAIAVALLAAAIRVGADRRRAVRRAGVALLATAGALWLLFDVLIATFLRTTRGLESEVGGRLVRVLAEPWLGLALVALLLGAALIGVSLRLARQPLPTPAQATAPASG